MRIRILIVEDEPTMVEILSRFLEPMASLIDTADELSGALSMAATNRYNVIILDLKLRLTGKEEAIKAIRKLKETNAAVVVVSGLPEPHLKDEVIAAGADAFVAKDGGFNARAVLIAANIATLKLPAGSYRSNSYLQHVEVLRKMMEEKADGATTPETTP